MGGGGHGQPGLQHTADHALHAAGLRQAADLQGVPDAAGLHKLDVDEVGGPLLDDAGGVVVGEHRLVRQDRGVHRPGDLLQAGQIVGGDGLFHQLDVQPPVLHGPDDGYRLLRGPALVGVYPEPDVRAHRPADGGHPVHVGQPLLAYLDL